MVEYFGLKEGYQLIYNELYVQNMMGPLERYGKILIKGMFEYTKVEE